MAASAWIVGGEKQPIWIGTEADSTRSGEVVTRNKAGDSDLAPS